jgi:hypothetical protein
MRASYNVGQRRDGSSPSGSWTRRTARFVVALLAMVSFGVRNAQTMDFSQTHVNPFDGSADPHPYLLMRGEIAPGDYDRLIKYTIENGLYLTTFRIILTSPGGDVTEALRIGKLLKSTFATVSVGPQSGQCASACFIVFASAVERVSMSGLIGIHRPYLSPARMRSLSPGEAEALETRAMIDAEDYLHQLRVPNNLVEIMFEHASNEIHWLTDDELERQLGKRPPWYEEFLIARCGLDKAAEQRFLAEPDDKVLYAQIVTVFDCGFNLTRADAEKNFAKALAPYNYGFSGERGIYKLSPSGSIREQPALTPKELTACSANPQSSKFCPRPPAPPEPWQALTPEELEKCRPHPKSCGIPESFFRKSGS